MPPGDISDDVYVLYVCWCLFVKEQKYFASCTRPKPNEENK